MQAAYADAVGEMLIKQVQDLKGLQEDLEEAGVVEWAIVVATALLDLRAVLRLLDRHHHLCPAFRMMLTSMTSYACFSGSCFDSSLTNLLL